jgi:hypothetical protein
VSATIAESAIFCYADIPFPDIPAPASGTYGFLDDAIINRSIKYFIYLPFSLHKYYLLISFPLPVLSFNISPSIIF